MGKMYHIQCAEGEIGAFVLLVENPADCDVIHLYLKDARQVSYSREYRTLSGTLDGVRVSICSCGMGSPSEAIAIEELKKCGAKTILRLGSSLAIPQAAQFGEHILATGAVKMDGTCASYAALEFPAVANYVVNLCLERAAIQLFGPTEFRMGIVEGRDVLRRLPDYDRTLYKPENLYDRAWRKGGVLCSDLGTAAHFIVCRYLGIRAGSLCVVGDETHTDIGSLFPWAIEGIRNLIAYDQSADDMSLFS